MSSTDVHEQIILLPKNTPRVWSLVRQQPADSYLILFIAAFGVTVIAVRVLLNMTGYPEVGNSTFHIAHMLYGGILLFAALIALLIWDNNWLWWASSLVGGIGVGLFIDEVGKFITQKNDYFFPLAFPIIYAFMLICVWLFLRVRRSQKTDSRTLLYHSLHDIKQLLDNDLDPFEHARLMSELKEVLTETDRPNEKLLAKMLLSFVQASDLQIRPEPNLLEQAWRWIKFIASQWPSRRWFRLLLVVGFALSALRSLGEVGALVTISIGDANTIGLANIVIVNGPSAYIVDHPLWLDTYGVGIVVVGLLSAVAAMLLLIGKERAGLRAGTLSLAISLVGVNLLTFYFSQLYAVSEVLGQLVVLFGAAIYRWRFYLNK